MEVEVDVIGDVIVLHLKGKMWTDKDSALFRGKFYEYIERGKSKFVVDFAMAEHLDTRGRNALLAAKEVAVKNNGDIKLACLPGRITRILEISEVLKRFEVFDSVEAAVKSFQEKG